MTSPRTTVLAALTAVIAVPVFAQATPHFESSSVVLRYSQDVALGEDESRKLFEKAMEILQSSNFNSSNPLWKWDEAKMNVEYGRAVSGRHVLVIFDKPEKIKTLGGLIDARELVIGLNGSQVASPVYTVDSAGKIIEHAKYLGQLCIEMMELAKDAAEKEPNKLLHATREAREREQ